jgi:hypothetical protein
MGAASPPAKQAALALQHGTCKVPETGLERRQVARTPQRVGARSDARGILRDRAVSSGLRLPAILAKVTVARSKGGTIGGGSAGRILGWFRSPPRFIRFSSIVPAKTVLVGYDGLPR